MPAKLLKISGADVTIDEEDWPRVVQYLWHVTKKGEVRAKSKGETLRLHRYIMNAKPNEQVVPLDGNLKNCTRANLKVTTKQLRGKDAPKSRSGYIGVYELDHRPGIFRATIKKTIIGYFRSAKAAGEAYDAEALKVYGSNAVLNFPIPR